MDNGYIKLISLMAVAGIIFLLLILAFQFILANPIVGWLLLGLLGVLVGTAFVLAWLWLRSLIVEIQARMQLRQLAVERERDELAARRQMREFVLPGAHTLILRDAEQGYLQFDALPSKPERKAIAGSVIESDVESVQENLIPRAPAFSEMQHLISEARMPLCYILEHGRSVPAYGTIDDLLSMAVTGKPGRGKTTALMYYVALLLSVGAEVYIFDPHGAMADLARFNRAPLPGMPTSARIVYVDRREEMIDSISVLLSKLDERDALYRSRRETLHPLLLLADELPVLADYDEQTEAEYKLINKRRAQSGQVPLEVPLMIELIRRFVLEARKWRCFFIGSGQSFDAEILPTRVTENLNSRIVFFSSDRRARMSGLENETIKELLPVIRRAGPGVMIFDCSRWDRPMIGAIPSIRLEDLVNYLGARAGAGDTPDEHCAVTLPDLPDLPEKMTGPIPVQKSERNTPGAPGALVPVSPGTVPESSPEGSPGTVLGPNEKRLTTDQARLFMTQYRQALRLQGHVDVKAILRAMRIGNAYYKHASMLAASVKAEVRYAE